MGSQPSAPRAPTLARFHRFRERARMIAYAIDARRQRFPEETPYEYEPLVSDQEAYRWTPAARADIHDYNLQDLGI